MQVYSDASDFIFALIGAGVALGFGGFMGVLFAVWLMRLSSALGGLFATHIVIPAINAITRWRKS